MGWWSVEKRENGHFHRWLFPNPSCSSQTSTQTPDLEARPTLLDLNADPDPDLDPDQFTCVADGQNGGPGFCEVTLC